MRLIKDDGHGSLRLVEQDKNNLPRYAILSHTWGADSEEVTFKDLVEGAGKNKAGYGKLEFCRKQAASDDLQHFWVDTCCIDKTSSAELTEAINSMFHWYHNAAKCYVYLSDVATDDRNHNSISSQSWEATFRNSRWFTRGWTLQELIAPPLVEFFSSDGDKLGDKRSLERQIHEITGVAVEALKGSALSDFSIAERMSWAEKRETKRDEDKAYSLLGIFDVYIPLIYGEGMENALRRLRDEIYAKTLLAARSDMRDGHHSLKEPPEGAKCLQDLFITDPSEDLKKMKRKKGERAKDTCKWMLRTEEINLWLDSDSKGEADNQMTNVLWLHGLPGTGKSTMSMFLAEELSKAFATVEGKCIAYFFCDSGFEERRTASAILRGLLLQLLQQYPQLLQHVMPKYSERGAKLFSSFDALWVILMSIANDKTTGTKYCVIDALDECDQESQECILKELENTFASGNLPRHPNIRLLITSRPYDEIKMYLENYRNRDLSSFPESEQDIEAFIKEKMTWLKRTKQYSVRTTEEVRQILLAKAKGTFLWIGLACDELNKVRAKDAVDHLRRLPKGLESLYAKLLDVALEQEKDKATIKQILSFVAVSVRPLTLSELSVACQLHQTKDEEDRINFTRDSIKSCRLLVVVQDEKILLLHQSVKDFLLRYDSEQFDILRIHATFAYQCIDYLIWNFHNKQDTEEKSMQKHFLSYSSRYWPDHAHMAQSSFAIQKSHAEFFDTKSACRDNWLKIISSEIYAFPFWKTWSIFHVAARWGILPLLDHVLAKLDSYALQGHSSIATDIPRIDDAKLAGIGGNIEILADSKDSHGRTPLSWAAEGGHEAVVRLLLERNDIDVNSKGDYGWTPLQRAAERGHKAVVKLLLERDNVNVNLKDDFGWTPLSWAAEGGHEAVVKLLLERDDVDVNSKEYNGWTPLLWAAKGGHEAVVKLLLERDNVNINLKDNYGWTPLQRAAEQGHEAVVKLLLERDNFDVDLKDNNSRTPLSWAAERGHKAVVEQLLERDNINVNSKNYNGRTPLSWAAEGGHEAVVKLLLERDDLDVNSKEYNGRTPLLWAAKGGHEAVVKLLLERDDVDVNSKDDDNWTLLLWAAQRGHESVVKLLLEWDDVEINSKDNYGRTPLSQAAEGGHEAVVKLLLERDNVDVNSKDYHSRTPLLWGAKGGHETVVKLLLERDDVDVNLEDTYDWTPLWWAAEGGHEAVVKLLLERNDVNVKSNDDDNWTLLLWAAERGHKAVVKLLLERDNVNVNLKDNYGWTPLSWAAEQGHEVVVKLLLGRYDVDVNLKDNYSLTPLLRAANKGHEVVVKLLLEWHDIDANSKDYHGSTPLSCAAKGGHEAVVKLLLERDDVTVNSKDNYSRTPLSRAAEGGHEAVVKLLLELDNVDVNLKDNENLTPLLWAAKGGHEAVVKLLLERDDINVNSKNYNGRTPLSWAAEGGHEAVVKLLLE